MGEIIPDNIFPVFQISYKRWRFVEPVTGMRFCLDCDISTPKVNGLVFPKANPLYLENGVFEMKGVIDEFPELVHKLTLLGCKKESFSKYCRCYQKLKEANRIN